MNNTDKLMVVKGRLDDESAIELVEVDVLKRHGEWALVEHRYEPMPEPRCTVTHVPSGLALVHVYSFEIDRTSRMLWMLPSNPAGLPIMQPQTAEDAAILRRDATFAPCYGELKAWVKLWMDAVER